MKNKQSEMISMITLQVLHKDEGIFVREFNSSTVFIPCGKLSR